MLPDRIVTPWRARIFRAALVSLTLACAAPPAPAQTWPERTVRIVNPFAVGSGSDIAARIMADRLTQRFGKPFVVDNRPGANAMLGTDLVAKAVPDGYTLLAGGSTTHAANLALYKSVPYDPVKDFSPIAFMTSLHYYLVVPTDSPIKSVKELIEHTKANARTVSYATGNASSTIAAEMLKLATGTSFIQVNYKGNTLAATDVTGGIVTTMFLDTSTAFPFLQGGKLRALALATTKRSSIFPNVPTMEEAGFPDFSFTSWSAIWGPANMPRAVVETLNEALNTAKAIPEVAQKLRDLGFTQDGPGARPEDLGNFVKTEIDQWARVVKRANIQVQP